ncbi:MAG: tetratricopeptide repeat protein [Saprospiraceae bacterium]|nr:tetratricopeptide repeat protein [Saprospiraceae bacterium]
MKFNIFFILLLISTGLTSQDGAQDYFNKAMEYVNKKDFATAIMYYDKAIQEKPDFTVAYYNREIYI